jgi:DNA (cytosine-5)-methyltransferase 1
MPRTKLTFIDLFCGIGGFHYAFEKAGAKCVWAADWDEKARNTYTENHGLKPWGDITKARYIDPTQPPSELCEDQIPPHDILCAGFPCQPFSIAGVSKKLSLGRKHGFEDEKQGHLFEHLARIIKHYKPKAFVLENVKNLKSHDKKRTFEIIMNTLHDLGYHVHTQIIDAQSYVPQHRERIFIVGFKDDLPFKFPATTRHRRSQTGARPTLGDILDKNVDPKYTLSDKLWNYLQNYAKKHKAAGNGFGCEVVGPDDVTRTLSARYYKDGSEILVEQKGRNPRRLTPNECRKLMGYPEEFKIVGADTTAYKQFGNSVVVPVVRAIADRVVTALNKQDLSGVLSPKGKQFSALVEKRKHASTSKPAGNFGPDTKTVRKRKMGGI